jgi:murein DD-endopeptidase MepM/ murein hydrolase activator NlpD
MIEASADGLTLGSVTLARHLLSHPAPSAVLDAVEGRVFSTLLFPVRGGEITRAHSSSRRPMEITGAEGTAIRAAADGTVVFAGTLPGHGDTVVVLHENGWATFYERVVLAPEVAIGSSVERGAWIAHAAARAMRFELRVGGVVRDPADVLVDPRESAGESHPGTLPSAP